MLAGVSTDYYVRLEQGRERHPSGQVLDALTQALDLGVEAEAHLYELAQPRPRRRGTAGGMEQVSPDLLRMMHGWSYTPALVCNRWLDVLARNPPVAILHDGLEYTDNLLRLIFLDPSRARVLPGLGTDRPRPGGLSAVRRGSGSQRSRPDRTGRRALVPERGLPPDMGPP